MTKKTAMTIYTLTLFFFILAFFLFYFYRSLRVVAWSLSLFGIAASLTLLIIFAVDEKERISNHKLTIQTIGMNFIKCFNKYLQALKEPQSSLGVDRYPFNDLLIYTQMTGLYLTGFRHKLPIKLQKQYDHFLMNFAELTQYLQEINIELSVAVAKSDYDSYRSASYYKKQNTDDIIDNHLIFLEDYLDILLMELYPFLNITEQKRFQYLWDDLKEDD